MQSFDLLTTDVDMPVDTGWHVIGASREHRGELPIIMQTGQARYTCVRRRAQEFGIFLIDKVDMEALLLPAARDTLA